jgi:hypothetical protein
MFSGLCSRLRFSHIETDTVATALVEEMPKPVDMGLLLTRRLELSKNLASEENWISARANLDGSIPFLEHADFLQVTGGFRTICDRRTRG